MPQRSVHVIGFVISALLSISFSGWADTPDLGPCARALGATFFELEDQPVLALTLSQENRERLADDLAARMAKEPRIIEIRYELTGPDFDSFVEARKKNVPAREAFASIPVFAAIQAAGFVVADESYDDLEEPFLIATPPLGAVLRPDNGDLEIGHIRLNRTVKNRVFFEKLLVDFLKLMKLKPDIQLRILDSDPKNPQALAELIPKALKSRVEISALPADSGLWSWPRDPSVVLVDGKVLISRTKTMAHSLEDEEFDVPAEIRAGYFATVENYAGSQGKTSRLRFEGGNVIAGSRHVFVGATVVDEAMVDHQWTEAQAITEIGQEFGLPAIVIGDVQKFDCRQPQQHIDLAMAVARDRKSGQEVILLESNQLARDLAGKGEVMDVMATNQLSIDDIERRLNQAEFQLRRQGYKVIRMPGLTYDGFLRDLEDRPILSIFNYTNVLLTGDVALVPTYGIHKLDEAAHQIYRELGYRVVPMHSARETFKYSGGPRCATETGPAGVAHLSRFERLLHNWFQ